MSGITAIAGADPHGRASRRDATRVTVELTPPGSPDPGPELELGPPRGRVEESLDGQADVVGAHQRLADEDRRDAGRLEAFDVRDGSGSRSR